VILFGVCLTNLLFVLALFGLTSAFYYFLRAVDKSKVADKDLPFVSVLVPARNEEGKIGRCLESLV
jgi:cellulose synthase/poly-beta-1,6-N-acetylglucosamine synthase-like glycosyltransferase